MRRELHTASMKLRGRSVSFLNFSCHSCCFPLPLWRTRLMSSVDAFIRDELSKGRYDPAIAKICFEILLELFERTLKSDLGPRDGAEAEVEDVC